MPYQIFATILPALLCAGVICAASESKIADDGWKLKKQIKGVALYERLRAGSPLKEFKAVGEIAASSRAVLGVIDDIDAYPSFMPYTTECRLLKREEDAIIAYQRLKPPLVSERDYTLRIRKNERRGDGGLAYVHRWEPANALGPAEKPGVVRVKLCEGGWLLEPKGPNVTLATYTIFTDTGGVLPAFIANTASGIAIPKIFEAIRKQVKNPKYSANQSGQG